MFKATSFLLASLLLSLTGCASLMQSAQSTSPGKAKVSYAERKQSAIAEFEKQRDRAQVQAALRRWELGETQQAQAMLRTIVQRSPANLEARLRLAEMLASGEESAAAEEQLRACLNLDPESAEVHHALSLLLSDRPGREVEAREHSQRAVELEPENAAYAAIAS